MHAAERNEARIWLNHWYNNAYQVVKPWSTPTQQCEKLNNNNNNNGTSPLPSQEPVPPIICRFINRNWLSWVHQKPTESEDICKNLDWLADVPYEDQFWHISGAKKGSDGLSSIKGGQLEGGRLFPRIKVIFAVPSLMGDSIAEKLENSMPWFVLSNTTDGVDQVLWFVQPLQLSNDQISLSLNAQLYSMKSSYLTHFPSFMLSHASSNRTIHAIMLPSSWAISWEKKDVPMMEYIPYSVNMSIIECLWDILGRRAVARNSRTWGKLVGILRVEWE